jgi:hypothetical protein
MRRRVGSGAAVLLLLGCGAGCAGSTPPSQALDKHYHDRAGWSIDYPGWMRVERSRVRGHIFIGEVTLASFAARKAVRVQSSAHEIRVEVDPPKPASGQFPADGVAVRVYRQDGGPPTFRNKQPQPTGFPLHLRQFRPSAEYPSSLPRPVAMGVFANGASYTVYAWAGPKASQRARAALASVVASLSFARA